jgi:hypothetical protein
MKGDDQRCLEAGMDGYVPKPIQAAALFAVVDRLCEEGRAPAVPRPGDHPPGPRAGVASSPLA